MVHKTFAMTDQLIDELKNAFDNYFLKLNEYQRVVDAFNRLKRKVSNRSLTDDEARVFQKMIFFPFCTRALNEFSPNVSIFMVNLIHWWVEKRNAEIVPVKLLSEILIERRCYDSSKINLQVSREKVTKIPRTSQARSLVHLIKLLKIDGISSNDCDHIIRLLRLLVIDNQSTVTDWEQLLCQTNEEFSTLWSIYFDPLLICSAYYSRSDRDKPFSSSIDLVVGQPKFTLPKNIDIIGREVRLTWSDTLIGNYLVSNLELSRQRVDDFVEKFFHSAATIDQRISLLKAINHETFRSKVASISHSPSVAFKASTIKLCNRQILQVLKYIFDPNLYADKSVQIKQDIIDTLKHILAIVDQIWLSEILKVENLAHESMPFVKDLLAMILNAPFESLAIEGCVEFLPSLIKKLIACEQVKVMGDFFALIPAAYTIADVNTDRSSFATKLNVLIFLIRLIINEKPTLLSTLSFDWIPISAQRLGLFEEVDERRDDDDDDAADDDESESAENSAKNINQQLADKFKAILELISHEPVTSNAAAKVFRSLIGKFADTGSDTILEFLDKLHHELVMNAYVADAMGMDLSYLKNVILRMLRPNHLPEKYVKSLTWFIRLMNALVKTIQHEQKFDIHDDTSTILTSFLTQIAQQYPNLDKYSAADRAFLSLMITLSVRSEYFNKKIADKVLEKFDSILLDDRLINAPNEHDNDDHEFGMDEFQLLITFLHKMDSRAVENADANRSVYIQKFLSILESKCHTLMDEKTLKSRVNVKNHVLIKVFVYLERLITDANYSDGKNVSQKLITYVKDALTDEKLNLILLIKYPYVQGVVVRLLCFVLNLSDKERSLLIAKYKLQLQSSSDSSDSGSSTSTLDSIDDPFSDGLSLLKDTKDITNNNLNAPLTREQCDDVNKQMEDILAGKITNLSSEKTASFNMLKMSESADSQLAITQNVKENVLKIIDVIYDPIPLLLEGPTGVGKSALITQVAKMTNNQDNFVRFNMSSRITIEDLFGKIVIKNNEISFEYGPFAKAFKDGLWLLLDELNLAQDVILRSIETALDSGVLTLYDSSDAQQPTKTISRHAKFRLFATQNPNAGFFKGKREKLSASFLDRFRIVIFEPLQKDDLTQIVKKKISSGALDDANVKSLVEDVHIKLVSIVGGVNFGELEPYSEITVRELIKLCSLIEYFYAKCSSKHPTINNYFTNYKNQLHELITCVYSARFREPETKTLINKQIVSFTEQKRTLTINADTNWKLFPGEMEFDSIVCSRLIDKLTSAQFDDVITYFKNEWQNQNWNVEFNERLCKVAFEIHAKVKALACNSKDFIEQHGFYSVDEDLVWKWIKACQNQPIESCVQLGSLIYQSQFRHQSARNKIQEIFSQHFSAQSNQQLFEFDSQNGKIRNSTHNPVPIEIDCGLPQKPFIVNERVLKLWKMMSICVQGTTTPILVTGNDGCGKSLAIQVYARLYGKHDMSQVCLTPESEPSLLVGQLVPNDNKAGTSIVWKDGAITIAYKEGNWILLDNLNQAESSVLERLNPVLEEQPVWILTEKGDIDDCNKNSNNTDGQFRVFATLNKPLKNKNSQLSFAELSPALYNRFCILNMDDYARVEKNAFTEEMKHSVRLMTNELDQMHLDLLVNFLWFIQKRREFDEIATYRNLLRFVDCVELLRIKYPNAEIAEFVWIAYKLVFEMQLKHLDAQKKQTLRDEIEKNVTKDGRNKSEVSKLLESQLSTHKDEQHVLVDSRLEIAESIVIGSSICSWPILLEGPAAVGKTSLISHLVNTLNTNIRLELMNNNSNTSIQDYFGTYLPAPGNKFVFQEGPLLRAVRDGHWFLADEFNLADPAVLNSLFPLLEGQQYVNVPGGTVDRKIRVHPNFRFFATQNDAKYANRNQLSLALRNRFICVQFNDFTYEELFNILKRKKLKVNVTSTGISDQNYSKLAKLYLQLWKGKFRITMREVVKCLNREILFAKSTSHEFQDTVLSLLTSPYCVQLGQFLTHFNTAWDTHILEQNINETSITETENGQVVFKHGRVSISMDNVKLDESPLFRRLPNSSRVPVPDKLVKQLVRLAIAFANNEAVLLVGPTSYKTFLLQVWSDITSREADSLIHLHLTPETDTADLVGQIYPYTFMDLFDLVLKQANLFRRRYLLLNKDKNVSSTSDNGTLLQFINKCSEHLKDLEDEINLIKKEANKNKSKSTQSDESDKLNKEQSYAIKIQKLVEESTLKEEETKPNVNAFANDAESDDEAGYDFYKRIKNLTRDDDDESQR